MKIRKEIFGDGKLFTFTYDLDVPSSSHLVTLQMPFRVHEREEGEGVSHGNGNCLPAVSTFNKY